MKANRDGSRPLARRKPPWIRIAVIHILYMVSAPGAWALQILEAADHAELTAEISASAVNRIALDGDRVSRVIQLPSALTVEHDPVRGDVYLSADRLTGAAESVTLYLGSERGFTYRLALTVAERDSAQILIRNAAAELQPDGRGGSGAFGYNAGGRVGELVALIRAVALREPLPGYEIVAEPIAAGELSGSAAIETWRGPRWTVRVLARRDVLAHVNEVEARGSGSEDAAALAEAYGPGAAAAWVSPPDTGANGGRIAVIVEPSPGAVR